MYFVIIYEKIDDVYMICDFQDSMMLLDNMTVVSKNPNYYMPALEAASLANLRTKVLPRENLRLLEEVGEGAFGKVYRGQLVDWI